MGNSGSGSAVNMDSPEGKLITSEIQSNCVVIFSKSWCSYCSASKQLCQKLGVDARVIELDKRQDGGDIQNLLGAMTGASTVCVGLYHNYIYKNDYHNSMYEYDYYSRASAITS
jgi:glutaredoxin 3